MKKRDRHRIYKDALVEIERGIIIWICNTNAMQGQDISELPELWAQRPRRVTDPVCSWWGITPVGRAKRVAALKKAIELSK